jgi:hypothetical protein
MIRAKQVNRVLPFLEAVLDNFRQLEKASDPQAHSNLAQTSSIPNFAAAELFDR